MTRLASERPTTWQWLGKLLLHSVFFVVGTFVVLSGASLLFHLLRKAGAQLPPNFMQGHVLICSLLVGFLAGFLVAKFRSSEVDWLSALREASRTMPIWAQPQFWAWTPYFCWMIFGVTLYVLDLNAGSALFAHHLSGTDLFGAFVTEPCRLGRRVMASNPLTCGYEIGFTMIWIGSLGYSLSLVPILLLPHWKNSSQLS